MDKKFNKPKKWNEVYPQGTKEGDEEQSVFISLARHPNWTFRSLAAIAKESNLSKQRVEEILFKYLKKNMVFQNPKNEDQWAYWEREPSLVPTIDKSIVQTDYSNRINKQST
jgi:hypothetical protein